MKLELIIFLILGGFCLVGYFVICAKWRERPLLQEALLLLLSGLSVAGAAKVFMYAFAPVAKGGPLMIEADIGTGGALIAGSLCLAWFGVESIVTTMLDVIKRSRRRSNGPKRSADSSKSQVNEM